MLAFLCPHSETFALSNETKSTYTFRYYKSIFKQKSIGAKTYLQINSPILSTTSNISE